MKQLLHDSYFWWSDLLFHYRNIVSFLLWTINFLLFPQVTLERGAPKFTKQYHSVKINSIFIFIPNRSYSTRKQTLIVSESIIWKNFFFVIYGRRVMALNFTFICYHKSLNHLHRILNKISGVSRLVKIKIKKIKKTKVVCFIFSCNQLPYIHHFTNHFSKCDRILYHLILNYEVKLIITESYFVFIIVFHFHLQYYPSLPQNIVVNKTFTF